MITIVVCAALVACVYRICKHREIMTDKRDADDKRTAERWVEQAHTPRLSESGYLDIT
jgi:hypothetical protein